jgi:hypothetical protein
MMLLESNNPATRVLTTAMQQWIKNPSINPQPTLTDYTVYQKQFLNNALEEQQQIGWKMLFRGYISQAWKTAFIFAIHEQLPPPGEKLTPINKGDTAQHRQAKAEVWLDKINSGLWTFAMAMWDQRNTTLHAVESSQAELAANAQINQLYEQIPIIEQQSRKYFLRSKEHIIALPMSTKLRWVKTATAIQKRGKERMTQGHQPIKNSLHQFQQTRPDKKAPNQLKLNQQKSGT